MPAEAQRETEQKGEYYIVRFVWEKTGGLVQQEFLEAVPERDVVYR